MQKCSYLWQVHAYTHAHPPACAHRMPTTPLPPTTAHPTYSQPPAEELTAGPKAIHVFPLEGGTQANIDHKTVAAFGDEWKRFKQFSEAEIASIGDEYFDLLPLAQLPPDARALDAGCGTGRWSAYLAKHVGSIDAVDASLEALGSAANLTAHLPNVRLSRASLNALPFAPGSFDFVMSLGVLHHIPNTALALQGVTDVLKPGGWGLFYLYYALDNRPWHYRAIFALSNGLRQLIYRLPTGPRNLTSDAMAVLLYAPLIALAWLLRTLAPRKNWYKGVPLHYYLGKSWWVVRNDARDRFGTPLEQRFTRQQLHAMLQQAGYEAITFSEQQPYWHVIARKKAQSHG